MTAIRHALQRELFQPDDERLLSLVNVVKTGGKKKKKILNVFLCIVVTTQHPISVRLYQVTTEKDDVYKKKRCWALRDVKQVNGINPRKALSEFELTIDTLYKWTATSSTEKDAFIKQLFKLSSRYLPVQKPDFINVPIPVDELEPPTELSPPRVLDGDGESQEDPERRNAEEYQPISAKEEADFRRLLAKCEATVGQADVFADRLNRELSVLDGANIQSIMGSEVGVAELMSVMDSALEQADTLEQHLNAYDQLLAYVRDAVEMMEEKDSLSHVETNNRKQLMEQLRHFLSALDLSAESEQVLTACQLSDPANISRCTRVAQDLMRCLMTKVDPGLDQMQAYKDQMKKFRQLSDRFAEKLVAHLTVLFQNLADLSGNGDEPGWHRLSLPKHSQRHHALMPFSELVMWLKQTRPEGHKALVDRYVGYTKELYKRDLGIFFDTIRSDVKPGLGMERKGSRASLHRSASGTGEALMKATSPTKLSSTDSGEAFQKLIDTLLSEVEPMVSAEQKFCVRFFHISAEIAPLTHVETQSIGSEDSGPMANDKKFERQLYEQIRSILSQLFKPLEAHLKEFVDQCGRANPVLVMILFVRLSKCVLAIQDANSYISVILGTMVVIVKRRFDVVMEAEFERMSEVRPTKRGTRLGVLENVRRFEELATDAEWAWADWQRRADLERWYPQLLGAATAAVERAAHDPAVNVKSPPAVVAMHNYHRLFCGLVL